MYLDWRMFRYLIDKNTEYVIVFLQCMVLISHFLIANFSGSCERQRHVAGFPAGGSFRDELHRSAGAGLHHRPAGSGCSLAALPLTVLPHLLMWVWAQRYPLLKADTSFCSLCVVSQCLRASALTSTSSGSVSRRILKRKSRFLRRCRLTEPPHRYRQ